MVHFEIFINCVSLKMTRSTGRDGTNWTLNASRWKSGVISSCRKKWGGSYPKKTCKPGKGMLSAFAGMYVVAALWDKAC